MFRTLTIAVASAAVLALSTNRFRATNRRYRR